MSSKTVILRGNGNAEIGFGHLSRLVALAEMLKDHFECTFLTSSHSIDHIIPDEFQHDVLPQDINELNYISNKYRPEDSIVICDGYFFKEEYFAQLKKRGFRSIYVDDFVKNFEGASAIINTSPAVLKNDYNLSKNTKLALGTRYALLRNPFLKKALEIPKHKNHNSVFVSFGGADVTQRTELFVEALLSSTDYNIHVMLPHRLNESHTWETNERVQTHSGLNAHQLVQVIEKTDFGIVASSVISLELIASRKPFMCGTTADNQMSQYAALNNLKAFYPLGDLNQLNPEELDKHLGRFVSDTNQFTENHLDIIDGKSNLRVLALVSSLIENIAIRKATNDDVMVLYHWANDKLIRSQSFISDPISLEDHKTWFNKKLESQNSTIYIATVGQLNAGVVRFEDEEDKSTVGISLGDEFRGLGLAAKILDLSCSKFHLTNSLPIHAFIKKSNSVSIKLFESVNFHFESEVEINGYDSVLYIRKIQE